MGPEVIIDIIYCEVDVCRNPDYGTSRNSRDSPSSDSWSGIDELDYIRKFVHVNRDGSREDATAGLAEINYRSGFAGYLDFITTQRLMRSTRALTLNFLPITFRVGLACFPVVSRA